MIIYIIKVPLSEGKVHEIVSEGDSASDKNWVTTLFRILDQAIRSQLSLSKNNGEKGNDKFGTTINQGSSGIELREVHSLNIGDIMKRLESSKKL